MTKLANPLPEAFHGLVSAAFNARERALAPYSGFRVGAALLSVEGGIFVGCNIEASNYSLTTCAERVALLTALSQGVLRFTAIAVVTDADSHTPPCGSCRQLLWEYCGDIRVVLANTRGAWKDMSLVELFPHPFDAGSWSR